MQNTCKSADFYAGGFPELSGDWPRLLHGCCTQNALVRTRTSDLLIRSEPLVARPNPVPWVVQTVV
jgi:hypothetical protein